MALLHNTTITSALLGRRMAGQTVEPHLPASGMVRAERKNWYAGDHTPDKKSGYVMGALPPATWMMPRSSGGLASINMINGAGSTSFAGNLGLNAQADLTGAGDITAAIAQLVISMVGNLTGSGEVSSADLRGYLLAVANLSGSGSVTSTLSAMAWATAATSGAGSVSGTANATGTLAATIRGYSDLTPEGIRDKVWSAIIEGGFSADQVLRLLAAHAAGAATGLEGATPQFKGLDGTTTRINANYSAGTRTINSLNGV